MQTSTCLLVSTILKTIPSDVNKSGKAFEILGKKASDLKAAFDNAGGGIRGVRSALAELTKKDFKLNDAGEIITKDNIDSFIPKIKNKQANDLAERIAELGEDNTSLDIFYQSLSKGEERYIKDFIKNTEDLSKVTGEDLVKANQNARQSALDQNEALQQQTLSAKAASFAMGALKAATNIGLAMLASLAINGIITLITNACQSIDEKIKELNQEFEQSVKKVKSISDEDFNKQFISEYRDIFLTIYEGMGSNSQIKKAVTLTATALKSLIHTLFQILAQLLKLIHKAALLLEILLVHLIFQL